MLRKIKISMLFLAVIGLVVGTVFSRGAEATIPGVNTLVNYNAAGGLSTIENAHISEDGNIVIGRSSRHDIIPSDPYSSSTASSLYTRNMQTGVTSYVATDLSGVPLHVDSYYAASRTGRYVAYTAGSTNVVTSPTVPNSSNYHVYLKDTLLGTTELVDKSSTNTLANIGGGGGTTQPYASSVSDDGRFVLFFSVATNLLSSGNPTSPNYQYHSYIRDMVTGQVTNPAVSDAGVRSNAVTTHAFSSCDGAITVFGTGNSGATNLTPQDDGQRNIYMVDIRGGFKVTNLTYAANSNVDLISLSCNGRYIVVLSQATNLTSDSVSGSNYHYFRYDRLTGEYNLIDKSTAGYVSSTQTMPYSYPDNATRIVSDDGKVVFMSHDKNMVSPMASRTGEVYLRNPEAGTTELVPINASRVEQNVNGSSAAIEINARGDKVVYESYATNLIPGITTSGQKLVLSKVE